MQSLLSLYRAATKGSHDSLDAAFGSLDLSNRADYVRFLRGHAMGLASIFDGFRRFVEEDLHLACPDYPAMLADDLTKVGVDARDLRSVSPAGEVSQRAAGYVIAGSRLGLAALARSGYWGRTHALPSTYMDDRQGLAIWKHTAAKLKQVVPDEARAERESSSAITVFDTFRDAFAASAPAAVR
ncbi:heme oxygenase [Novosphingobium sp. RD2P27]|uniref:Heme oxygenase n=1 Tax=Novosphingobium kalidii TaxID=3230299 RepID=A0ABV2D639_9SPHN